MPGERLSVVCRSSTASGPQRHEPDFDAAGRDEMPDMGNTPDQATDDHRAADCGHDASGAEG